MYYKSDEGKNLDCTSGGHHLEFVRTGNSTIRSAFPQNPTTEPNMKWIE